MSSTVTATEIKPFHVEIPEERLDDLRRRIEATRWPSKELVPDRSQGVQPRRYGESGAQALAEELRRLPWREGEVSPK